MDFAPSTHSAVKLSFTGFFFFSPHLQGLFFCKLIFNVCYLSSLFRFIGVKSFQYMISMPILLNTATERASVSHPCRVCYIDISGTVQTVLEKIRCSGSRPREGQPSSRIPVSSSLFLIYIHTLHLCSIMRYTSRQMWELCDNL